MAYSAQVMASVDIMLSVVCWVIKGQKIEVKFENQYEKMHK